MQRCKHYKRQNLFDNPSCIDLFITNRPNCFQNTTVGLSDFHKMAVIVLEIFFGKVPPKKCFTEVTKKLSKINSNVN